MSSENKTKVTAKIIRERVGSDLHRILVVGCGSGIEAAILAQELKAKVFGIDINPSFDPIAAKKADLREGDATSLEFVDEYFDFVYSYHVLEHIPNFRKALFEIRRCEFSFIRGYCGNENIGHFSKRKKKRFY